MDFLCILQVSRFVFVLTTNFHNYFTVFNLLWTGRQFLEKSGGLGVRIYRHRAQLPRMAGSFSNIIGFLM
jgi:hypothetical protein